MTVSERLIEFVLEREGASKGLTVDQLKAVCLMFLPRVSLFIPDSHRSDLAVSDEVCMMI